MPRDSEPTAPTIFGLTKAEVEGLVDLAINSGAVVLVVSADLIVVPDTTLLEGFANREPYTPTTLLRRLDGRTAALYRLPVKVPK